MGNAGLYPQSVEATLAQKLQTIHKDKSENETSILLNTVDSTATNHS